MQIVFRTDASVQIGTGHVMRCLTLADALHLKGANCTFICRGHTGHLIDLIRQRGHHAVMLAASDSLQTNTSHEGLAHAAWLGTDWATDVTDTQYAIGSRIVDWLVVDHYALDHHWEKAMRPLSQQLMVIDDLADRMHDCDLLLDQNLGRVAEDYRQLVPQHATTLIGPRYALLRPEFASMREDSLARRKQPQLEHLLITLGGVDKDNLTSEVLQTLRICNLPTHLRITVVMGAHAPWLPNVQAVAAVMPRPTQVLVNVNHMARLMTECDLVIGTAGGTAWECCSLGLPSLVITAAQNQRNGAIALQKNGAAYLIESTRDIANLIENPLLSGNQPTWLQQLSSAAATITNGNGSAWVLQEMRRANV
jgi:UDP-2,4-diacetamido-2,4,6-trideoxy-beta-L-altropyranose hydrolase